MVNNLSFLQLNSHYVINGPVNILNFFYAKIIRRDNYTQETQEKIFNLVETSDLSAPSQAPIL